MQAERNAHPIKPATRDWYAGRTTTQLRRELRGARQALALALPYRDRDLRARIVCDSNERAIPMLETLIEGRSS